MVQSNTTINSDEVNLTKIKWLTYMMFFVFAMTSDAVGVIIPELIKDYGLTLTQASAFHYVPMAFIAFSGLFLGFLADKLGRKITISLGLMLFSVASFMFAAVDQFSLFILLLAIVGCAIGLFKTGALALIGDISKDSKEHTATMNKTEGFFGIGAMVGPAVVSYLLISGASWKYLYVAAAIICLTLCAIAYFSEYPKIVKHAEDQVSLAKTLTMMKDKYALGFSFAIALYVAVEVAIYVWMPSLLADYQGDHMWLATYALSIFFALRAGGRFLGAWMLSFLNWQTVILVSTSLVAFCYIAAMVFGREIAIWALPLSGLFMSVIYPTINSKGISCYPKYQHGAVAGVILFFTAVAAAIGPLVMGVISDNFGGIEYGFYFATALAVLLAIFAAYNWAKDPAQAALNQNRS